MPASRALTPAERSRLLDLVKDVWPAVEKAESVFQTTLQNGNPVIHPAVTLLNAALLERTGGQFYDAPSASELGKVYDDIGSKVGYREERKDATHWPLGVGVAFLVVAAGLSLAWQQKLP